MNLMLELNENPTALVPGQTIGGTAGWDAVEAPKMAVLRLFWYTEGRGTQDVGIVEELALPVGRTNCRGTFHFAVPELPYSFYGSLIALKWAIELVVDKGKHVERLGLVVSPWVEPVTLQRAE